MNWTEVKIYTTTAGIDPLTGSMLDLGLQGFMIEDAQDFDEFLHDTTPHWDYVDQAVMEKMKDCETCVTIYVADNPQGMEELMQVRQILARLKAQDPDGKYGPAGIGDEGRGRGGLVQRLEKVLPPGAGGRTSGGLPLMGSV